MRFRAFALFALGILLVLSTGLRGDDAEDKAYDALKKLKAPMIRDAKNGNAVISVNLNNLKVMVTDKELEHVAAFKKLQNLDLNSCFGVTDKGLKNLDGLTELTSLYLNNTKVTDAGTTEIGKLKKLKNLGLIQTAVTDKGLKNLDGLTEMQGLNLFGLKGVTDEGMKSLAKMTKLQNLDIRLTPVTDKGIQELAGMKDLRLLQIGGPKITDASAKTLAGLTELQTLEMSGSDITDASLKEFAKLPKLSYLGIGGAKKVTDAGVADLKKALPKLQVQK
jgi:Leucine-rich repeat (LRR) protein